MGLLLSLFLEGKMGFHDKNGFRTAASEKGNSFYDKTWKKGASMGRVRFTPEQIIGKLR